MSTHHHPWLPTTPKQSILVYALNVLLLCNLTVIVVMLSGTGPAQDYPPQAFDHRAAPPVYTSRLAPEQPPEPAVLTPAVFIQPAPLTHPEPTISIQPAQPVVVAAPQPLPHTPATQQPTREQTHATDKSPADPPQEKAITFFGVPTD